MSYVPRDPARFFSRHGVVEVRLMIANGELSRGLRTQAMVWVEHREKVLSQRRSLALVWVGVITALAAVATIVLRLLHVFPG